MNLKTILASFTALLCMDAVAQQKDSTRYEIHLSATAIFSGGNLQRTVSQNRLWGNIGNNTLQFVSENSYRYGRNFARVVENDFLTRNYIRLLPGHKLYGFAAGTYENNFKRSIVNRWQAGGGAVFNLRPEKKDALRMSAGLMYEETVYKSGAFNIADFNGNTKITELRGIIRAGGLHRISGSRLLFRHDTWFMQGLKKTENYRWHLLAAVQAAVYKGLSFKAEYEYTYESVTISSRNPFGYPSSTSDWVVSFGVSFDISNAVKGN